ncbi:hypothetical protein THF1C08_600014 [Vibrio jasicida]|uniref:Uncharacterized protein n=1 Tax=Vibrio jasicida TaxID=766224 RepID=A0AAU9QUL0_9VIBR|nr:hypothetical protein THF1C08_600014 [Vibrio jasicida]CAH1602506.1 hypothetical protein THF1A12_590019 [Vibrio jasicida]
MIVTLSLVYVTGPVIAGIRKIWDSGVEPQNNKEQYETKYESHRVVWRC